MQNVCKRAKEETKQSAKQISNAWQIYLLANKGKPTTTTTINPKTETNLRHNDDDDDRLHCPTKQSVCAKRFAHYLSKSCVIVFEFSTNLTKRKTI